MDLQDRSETLATFQALTGEQDTEKCIQILDRNEWNLNAALHELSPHLVSSPQPSSSQSPSNENNNSDSNNNNNNNNNNEGEQGEGTLIRNGLSWAYNSILWVFRFVFTFIGTIFPFGRLFRFGGEAGSGGNPVAEAATFIREYEENYGGPECHPNFHQGSYSTALQRAKKDIKFVLVYLHSPNHMDTPKFCRETLGSPSVIDYLNNNFVLFGAKVQSSQGYRLSYQLRASTYPFFALISPHSQTVALLGIIEGTKTSEQFLAQLRDIMAVHSSILNNARRQQVERERNRRLREEQDSAYQDALAEDREKTRKLQEEEQKRREDERKKREEEERIKQERERIRLEEERKVQEQERKKKEREQRWKEFPEEPSSNLDVPSTLICFKFPSGLQKKRRFLKTDKIGFAYDYVSLCQDEIDIDNYWLASNFPRKLFTELDMSFQDLEFENQALLFLEEK